MAITNLPPIPLTAPAVGSRWRHWKGECVARVLNVGYQTESVEILVSYLEEQSGIVFMRPLSMWQDQARPGIRRFTLIREDDHKSKEEVHAH